jgi:hypothetical protein
MPTNTLDATEVIVTSERLLLRIRERFPGSGLSGVCGTLIGLARDTRGQIERIGRPNLLLRGLAVLAILTMAAVLGMALSTIKTDGSLQLGEFLQALEAATSEMVFLSIGAWFLWSLDLRLQRRRALRWINRLRDLAHLIDMHQLTKDPDMAGPSGQPTAHSPQRDLDPFALGRYLDYCAEMLSLLSKLGYLAVARLDDPQAIDAATGLEDLTSGLSRKIWQKIMILRAGPEGSGPAPKKG